MKKWLIAVVICCAVLGFGSNGCLKDGADGASGSSGQDAVVNTWTYEFIPDTNPYLKSVSELSLTKVKSGLQTVVVYGQESAGNWVELPFSVDQAGSHVEHTFTVSDQSINLRTEIDGVLSVGAAIGGGSVRVVLKEFNK